MLGYDRIYIDDITLDHTDERMLMEIAGHEIGHLVNRDKWIWCLVQTLLALATFLLADRLGGLVIRRFRPRLGFETLASPGSLPILLLAYQLVFLATIPGVNSLSRWAEYRADQMAMDLTHDNEAAIEIIKAYMGMAKEIPQPSWFSRQIRGSHPSLEERAEFFEAYHPWQGQ
jgi:Zn-dependent protease with chaperone function